MPAAETVTDLIARYQLRSRATTEVFTAGVRLAVTGAVRLDTVLADEIEAEVGNGSAHRVRITAAGNRLSGTCSCGVEDPQVCMHQVAAAHALWIRDWGQSG